MIALRMAMADLRDSWSACAAVSFTFLVTSTAVGLSALVLNSATVSTGVDEEYLPILLFEGYTNIIFCSLVALLVVSSSTRLVVASRRGAIARLLLAGAGPSQVIRMLVVQIGVVALACSVLGNLVAVASQKAVLEIIATDRGFGAPESVVSPSVLLASSLYCAVVAMLGGVREARRATMIPPVEALRASNGADTSSPTRSSRLLRWGGFATCCVLIVAAIVVFQAVAPELGVDGFDVLFQISVVSLVLVLLAFSLVAGFIIGPITRVWTRIVPLRGPSWHLARHMVSARADRLKESVVPVMISVGLVLGMMSMVESINATFVVNDFGYQLDGASIISLFGIFGLSLAIALAGSVGNLVMMTRQRDAELALDSVVGATPRQQVLLPALEATIVTGTSGLLALAAAGVSVGVLGHGMPAILDASVVSMPWGTLLGTLLAMWIITLAATVVPSLPSLSAPAPRVIARLAAS